MRYQKEETLILDELTLDDDFIEQFDIKGVFSISNEFDSTNLVFVNIGTVQIGFVQIDDLLKFAEKIVEVWGKKEEVEKP